MTGFGMSFDVDGGSVIGVRDHILRGNREASEGSVEAATKWLERELEAVTRGAVPGRLWRAWALRFYRNEGRSPAGIVYVKGSDRTKGAMAFWTQPGRVTGKRGQWLAVPTKAVPTNGRDRQPMTPAEVEAKFGKKLVFIKARGSRYATLNMEAVLNRRGKSVPLTIRRARADRRAGRVRKLERVVMFTLIPHQQFGNAFAIEPTVMRGQRRLTDEYVTRVGRLR